VRQLHDLTVRELISELAEVETAIRLARMPTPVQLSTPPGTSLDGWEDLAVLAAREQQIVFELRRRRRRLRLPAFADLVISREH
jgi:hypothetical protein